MEHHNEMSLDHSEVVREIAQSEDDEAFGKYVRIGWFYRAMEAIKSARVRNGLRQEDVAQKIGTTQSVIARLENSHTGNFSVDRFLEYAWASGIAPLDVSFVSQDVMREYIAANPAASRTKAAVRAWQLRDAFQEWGINVEPHKHHLAAHMRIETRALGQWERTLFKQCPYSFALGTPTKEDPVQTVTRSWRQFSRFRINDAPAPKLAGTAKADSRPSALAA